MWADTPRSIRGWRRGGVVDVRSVTREGQRSPADRYSTFAMMPVWRMLTGKQHVQIWGMGRFTVSQKLEVNTDNHQPDGYGFCILQLLMQIDFTSWVWMRVWDLSPSVQKTKCFIPGWFICLKCVFVVGAPSCHHNHPSNTRFGVFHAAFISWFGDFPTLLCVLVVQTD